jgi:hypothetical protein
MVRVGRNGTQEHLTLLVPMRLELRHFGVHFAMILLINVTSPERR